ncbi:MAG: bifunctional aspartate kinase/diaminopimelate decarboxylase [Xanthomonadales bacterium]|nr:bifunctional aspartate kinase/diaminopimelate decarboxylase [Xanthomonadales bacterium]
MKNSSHIVLKFGGTSVAGVEQWKTISDLCQSYSRQGLQAFLVCSALNGISNLLETLIVDAVLGKHQDILSIIQEKHFLLIATMGLRNQLLSELFQDLIKVIEGVALRGTIDPGTQAKVMAFGELFSTRIGCAWLQSRGLNCLWLDARECLTSVDMSSARIDQQYLAATVRPEVDLDLQAQLLQDKVDVCITQGFIAANQNNNTVLLGRGGSDTSAALFAVALDAKRLEIWTDVPGMFTANPRQVDSAHLILQLNYAEAQELATTGAKVLHPACLGPVEAAGIPLHIRWTAQPEVAGTVISASSSTSAGVKGISSKRGIWLISMESLDMWQSAGFLADIFTCFKRQSISIDLVSTSESNVTVSLDGGSNVLNNDSLDELLQDLSQYCQPKVIGPVATVTLVGSRIRSILHRLGPAFSLFEDKQIYLLSQSASDLNLSIATGEEEADQLVELLHSSFFSGAQKDAVFGPTWLELEDGKADISAADPAQQWWQLHQPQLLKMLNGHPAAYVYALPEIQRAVEQLRIVSAFDRLHYAMKANNNPQILALLAQLAVDFDCVSIDEIHLLQQAVPGLDPERILFTPNFAAIEEYSEAYAIGCRVTLDNLYCLQAHPEVFKGRDLVVRLDPESVPAGHHKHVQTTGRQSKFGIAGAEMERLRELCRQHEVNVFALHSHVGSGIHDPHTWLRTAQYLHKQAQTFPAVKALDLGGGFGVEEQPGQATLDFKRLQNLLQKFKQEHPQYSLWAEPGRFLVSSAGVLLAQVTQIKTKDGKNFIGMAAGMNALIRPSLYGAFHHIVNLSRLDEPAEIRADIVGPICETGDVLGHDRWLPDSREGDILMVANAGAYAQVMASTYNAREIPPEIVLEKFS